MDNVTTRILVGIMFTLWIVAAFLGFNDRNLTNSYEQRVKLWALCTVLIIGGVWCLVFVAK